MMRIKVAIIMPPWCATEGSSCVERPFGSCPCIIRFYTMPSVIGATTLQPARMITKCVWSEMNMPDRKPSPRVTGVVEAEHAYGVRQGIVMGPLVVLLHHWHDVRGVEVMDKAATVDFLRGLHGYI